MSPTVEPDPDNTGVGNILAQAVPLPDGLFFILKVQGSKVRYQKTEDRGQMTTGAQGRPLRQPAAFWSPTSEPLNAEPLNQVTDA